MHRRPRIRAAAVSTVALLTCTLAYLAIGAGPSASATTGTPTGIGTGAAVEPGLELTAATKRAPHGPFAGMTAAQIRARALLAMRFGPSVRVQGTVVYQGKTFGIDMQVGKDATGTLTYDKGWSLTLRRVGTQLYERPDDAYYTAHGHSDMIATRHATWISFGVDDGDYKATLPLTRIATWTKLLAGVPATTRKAGVVLGGIPTVALIGGHGPRGTLLYVASKGPSFPLYALSTDRRDRLAFQHWNTPFTVNTPATAHILPEAGDAILDIPKDPVASAKAFGAIWQP